MALVLGAACFLYPSVQYVNLFEFHEIALATPVLAFAVYFLLHRRDVPFLVLPMEISRFARNDKQTFWFLK